MLDRPAPAQGRNGEEPGAGSGRPKQQGVEVGGARLPGSPEAALAGSPTRPAPRWPLGLAALAGLIGAAGVAVGAAGAHLDVAGGHGADLARTSSTFLLVHAAAVMAGSGLALALGGRTALLAAGLGLLAVGAVLFGGDLALLGLFGLHPVPLAAPVGGLCLIAGWLCLAAGAARQALVRR